MWIFLGPGAGPAKVWRYTPGERSLTLLAALPCDAVPSCIAMPGGLDSGDGVVWGGW